MGVDILGVDISGVDILGVDILRLTPVIALKHLPLVTQVLSKLYTQTLSALQRLPKDAAYRHHTEQVVQQRLQVVQAETSVPIIEEKIGCGQVEELIDQVRRGCG